jgi:hypothetical protein
MPDTAPKPPRKELKDIPAECDALKERVLALEFDHLTFDVAQSLVAQLIGIPRLLASRSLELIDAIGKRLKEQNERIGKLEVFAEMAMHAVEEQRKAAEAAAAAPAEVPPKGKPKKNGLKAVPPPADKPATEVKP